VLLGETESPPLAGSTRIPPEHYDALTEAVNSRDAEASTKIGADARLATLRDRLTEACLVDELKDALFEDVPIQDRQIALERFLHLIASAEDSVSKTPFLSLRYHFFLRALEGAFVSYRPTKRVRLTRGAAGQLGGENGSTWFEVALCRECGQHYFVGQREDGYLREALRDLGTHEFKVFFFRPLEMDERGEDSIRRARLCVVCGAISRNGTKPGNPCCGHNDWIEVVEDEVRERAEDQLRKCGHCGYIGADPVREIVHGNDGSNAVVATVLHQLLPEDRRKVLGFVDGRQEAAFFAWYLGNSYEALVRRNLILASLRALAEDGHRDVSLSDLAERLRSLLRQKGVSLPSASELAASK
jgi:hypothetical protein